MQGYRRYAERVGALLEQPWPLTAANELDPPSIALSASAKAAWVAFYNDIERSLGPDGRLATVRSLASKAPEHVARLAGTFAVFDGDAQIDASHIDRSVLLMQHYLAEALRLWGAGQVSAELKLAQDVLNWLRDKMGPGARDADVTEPEVVLPMLHNFAAVWRALYPAEQQRIARLLIESVVVSQEAVSIVWRDAGWAELARELRPDDIGAELLELQAQGAYA
jgi:hypothetical protein